MDLKTKRKEIRKEYFFNSGLIVISVLGLIGVLMIYYSGLFNIKNYEMLYDCIAKNGIMIIFGSFFFIIFLCYIIFLLLNLVLKPKEEVLYLQNYKNNEMLFLNKKGKKFIYNGDKNLKVNNYYNVLKTHNIIYEVVNQTTDTWLPKEKRSYWLNFYSPMGNFENLLVLPIVYVILLPGILSFFMSKGYQKIFGLIYSLVPIYIIIYDLIYKYKLSKSENKTIDDKNLIKSYETLQTIIFFIAASIVCVIIVFIFFNLTDLKYKLIFSPFLGCGICCAGNIYAKAFNNYELANIFSKGYIVIFLVFWFGFLSFWTVGAFKQSGNYLMLIFSIPFWLAGFYVFYKYFIKNK